MTAAIQGGRSAEVEALRVVDAFVAQQLQGRLILDAFRNGLQAKSLGEADDGPFKKAKACWLRITRQQPRLFAHWAWIAAFW